MYVQVSSRPDANRKSKRNFRTVYSGWRSADIGNGKTGDGRDCVEEGTTGADPRGARTKREGDTRTIKREGRGEGIAIV